LFFIRKNSFYSYLALFWFLLFVFIVIISHFYLFGKMGFNNHLTLDKFGEFAKIGC